MKWLLLLLVFVGIFLSCKKDKIQPVVEETVDELLMPTLPSTPFAYDDFVPHDYLTGQAYDLFNTTPSDNPVTNHGATLGRVLFYDVQLSKNNTIACASCHQQEYGFSDPEQFSTGLYGQATDRHSMPIINLFMGFRFFWDMRANGLENQALMPIEHPVEMDMDLTALTEKIGSLAYYPELFNSAFGTPEITEDRISRALSQFMRSIYSIDSKYDQGMQTNFANYTAQELMGKDLFFLDARTNCNNCHQTHYFFNPSPRNNGSELVYTDEGVAGISGNPNEVGFFKIPTLRNIEYTAPYFHDGRFSTLEEVVEFYNSGMQAHPNLDERLTTNAEIGGPPRQMNLSQEEKDALVAFMKTLSEPAFLTKERWSDPFK